MAAAPGDELDGFWQAGAGGSAATGSGRPVSFRPANLPPKGEDELLHHTSLVRDLERTVQRRLEREEREEQHRKAREEQREHRLHEHMNIWLKQLLPAFAPGTRPTRRMER